MADYDLILRGGEVHDGLGSPGRIADVAVRHGRIVAIGAIEGSADEEIEASGRLVTPGFVDVHTHYDGQATWENRLAPSSNHGVTTVVMGNCGVGFAPCRPAERAMLMAVMEGVEDVPELVMTEGLPWNWETFPDYLDALDERALDVDVAAQLPHSALRVYVMGERAAGHEPPDAADLAEMRRLTAEAIRAGALGVTTSRNLMHRTRAGDLAPSLYSEEDELVALAHGLRDAGAGVFQLIPHITAPAEDEFRLMRRVAEESRRPLSYSLLQMPTGDPGQWRTYLNSLTAANADGLTIRAQVAPRPVGMLYGLDLSFHPFVFHPSFQSIADLPLAEKVVAMRDPTLRAQLLSERPDHSNPVLVKTVTAFRFAYPMGRDPDYEPDLADRIDNRAKALGRTPEDVAYDLLLEDDGRAILYQPGANYRDGNLDAVRTMLGHPDTIVGLADGGAHYGIICDASFPTFFLERWARDADAAQRIALPDAIAALTSQPADAVGLGDRGRIVVGAKADLNVIDLARLHLHRPSVARDLPAGGKRLRQGAEGYDVTIVSGAVTYRGGEPSGVLPGRLVRGARGLAA
ncbi:N-acyl-D-amino-acid deacylase family protein [Sphingomonas oryzagri]